MANRYNQQLPLDVIPVNGDVALDIIYRYILAQPYKDEVVIGGGYALEMYYRNKYEGEHKQQYIDILTSPELKTTDIDSKVLDKTHEANIILRINEGGRDNSYLYAHNNNCLATTIFDDPPCTRYLSHYVDINMPLTIESDMKDLEMNKIYIDYRASIGHHIDDINDFVEPERITNIENGRFEIIRMLHISHMAILKNEYTTRLAKLTKVVGRLFLIVFGLEHYRTYEQIIIDLTGNIQETMTRLGLDGRGKKRFILRDAIRKHQSIKDMIRNIMERLPVDRREEFINIWTFLSAREGIARGNYQYGGSNVLLQLLKIPKEYITEHSIYKMNNDDFMEYMKHENETLVEDSEKEISIESYLKEHSKIDICAGIIQELSNYVNEQNNLKNNTTNIIDTKNNTTYTSENNKISEKIIISKDIEPMGKYAIGKYPIEQYINPEPLQSGGRKTISRKTKKSFTRKNTKAAFRKSSGKRNKKKSKKYKKNKKYKKSKKNK